MKATVNDRILLLLSIKEPEKKIGFNHIFEKISRDEKGAVTENEVRGVIGSLQNEGLLTVGGENFYITDRGFEVIKKRLDEVGDDLNLSYRMVLIAKEYYGNVAEFILPFISNRPVSVVKVFSDDSDPINRVKPLFVRYARYKPKPVFIHIETREHLKGYVDDHALDFVPYVHSFDMTQPSWLVFDLDAGDMLKDKEEGFLAVKFVARALVKLLQECDVNPSVKFSGSRGLQVWASIDNEKLPNGDKFAIYRRIIQQLQGLVEDRISVAKVPGALKQLAENGLTTSSVAKKEERSEKVLLDWSSMKLYGDVRAPFSMHYKTGLISCPIDPSRIDEFSQEQARPETVSKGAASLARFFDLPKCDPTNLLKAIKKAH